MTIFVALVAGIATFLVSALSMRLVTGFLAEAHQLFALLSRVQPYKTIFSLIVGFVAAWSGLSVFDAIV